VVSPLLHGGIGFNVDLGDKVGPHDGVNKHIELFRAVHVYLFMERTSLARALKGVNVGIWLELVIESLELQLQLGSVGHGEALVGWDLAEMSRD
jgi:hypothetical protein